VLLLLAIACQAPPRSGDPSAPTDDEVGVLAPMARANRVSRALRGVPPSATELATVQADPDALDELVEQWMQTDAFGATVRDLHADLLWMRADVKPQWPNRWALEVYTQAQVTASFQEAPLMLVEDIVRSGQPYTAVLTADYTLADEVIATMEGLPYDPSGPQWQATHHVDGRPQVGLLSSTGLWQRWYTNHSGKHRNRANLISRAFLCDEIGARDMTVFPDADSSDNAATADALRTDPGCIACHVDLDPLAAYFWPYEINIIGRTIDRAQERDCDPDQGGNPAHCYPIRYYDPDRLDEYLAYDLPAPGYYGAPGEGLHDLAHQIAADPRFARCTVDTAWAWFTQRDAAELPGPLRDELVTTFVDSGHDYRALVGALVRSDAMADATVEPLQLRPEALGRLLADVVGADWVLELASHGDVPALQSSKHGLRDLAGGVDHDMVLRPNFSPSPTGLLARDAVAQQAAAEAVQRQVIDPTVADELAARAQLAELATATTGQLRGPDDPLVDELWALHVDAFAHTDDRAEAWRITLRGLFVDPSTHTY